MSDYEQTQADLLQHLQERVDILRTEAAEYDKGKIHFAKPLSTSLRILLHQTAKSHSLLAQLGLLDQLQFLDSGGDVDQRVGKSNPPLTIMRMELGTGTGQPITFLPQLSIGTPRPERPAFLPPRQHEAADPPRSAPGMWWPFRDWWTLNVLMDDSRATFTREDVVLFLAHKDGGAHIDPRMNQAWAGLSRQGSLGWTIGDGVETWLSTANPIPPTVRQIAWEVERSLTEQVPTLQSPRQ